MELKEDKIRFVVDVEEQDLEAKLRKMLGIFNQLRRKLSSKS